MTPKVLQLIVQGVIACIAVGGAVAYALIAQQRGLSPEPPAWLAILIGIIGGAFYSSQAHSNGNTAALQTFAAAYAAQHAAVAPTPPAVPVAPPPEAPIPA